MERKIAELDMQQYAIKIIINSGYGALGNGAFRFYDPDLAQSITLQGQDLIQFSLRAINHYLINKWHADTELHEKLGISRYKINAISCESSIYSDTDSAYVTFGAMFDSIEGLTISPADRILFIKQMMDNRISQFLQEAFLSYAKNYNTENHMDFKMENISSCGIWVAKKCYVIRVMYGDFLLSEPKLEAKGIPLAKPSYPIYARKKLKELTNVLLDKGNDTIIERDIIPMLKEYRRAFDYNSIEDISFNFNVTTYDKYGTDDNVLEIPKGMGDKARACYCHNHLITKTGSLKYLKIREGDKVKFYHVKDTGDGMDTFAFMPGYFPIEFAYPIDYDEQFFRLMVEPVNSLLDAMGMHEITKEMARNIKITLPKLKVALPLLQMGPYYVLDAATLEYELLPQHLNPYLDGKYEMQNGKLSDEFIEYLSYITRYKKNTEVVSEKELQKYIKKKKTDVARKQAKEQYKTLDESVREIFEESVDMLKRIRVTYKIDQATMAPCFAKGKKTAAFTWDQLNAFDNCEEMVGYVKGCLAIEDAPDEPAEKDAAECEAST